MTRGTLLAGAVASAFLAVSIGATPAFADDQPHFFDNDPTTTGWTGGCAVTYSLTPEAADYAPYAEAAYAAISGPTNFTFTRLPDGDSSASIRISINSDLDGAAGWGSTSGEVQLAPQSLLPDWRNETNNTNLRISLVAHESMHTLGLDHDNDPDQAEVMFPIMDVGPITFGPSDLAGLTVLKTQNHCVTAGVPDPAYTAPVATSETGPQVSVVLAIISKARCKKLHGKWSVKTHRCFIVTAR